MYQEYLIYWIHSDQETNIEEQGYVGITKDLTRRLKEHAKRPNFLDNRRVDIFLYGDQLYCRQIEKSLRPNRHVGLNIAEGGGLPPDHTGRKLSALHRQKIKDNMVGFKGRTHSEETKLKMSLSQKGRPGRVQSEETKRKISMAQRSKKFVDQA